jgi:hypothetical protein
VFLNLRTFESRVVAPGEIKEHPHNTRFPFAERNLADFFKFSAFFEKIKMPMIIRVFLKKID